MPKFPYQSCSSIFDQALLSLSTILITLHRKEVTKITMYKLRKIIIFISSYWKIMKTSTWWWNLSRSLKLMVEPHLRGGIFSCLAFAVQLQLHSHHQYHCNYVPYHQLSTKSFLHEESDLSVSYANSSSIMVEMLSLYSTSLCLVCVHDHEVPTVASIVFVLLTKCRKRGANVLRMK
jgi:hypothetical protein